MHLQYLSGFSKYKSNAICVTRDGLFPGTSCIKLSGVTQDTGQLVVVRGCALDSGGTTADTELVRISNCGAFQFEDK